MDNVNGAYPVTVVWLLYICILYLYYIFELLENALQPLANVNHFQIG